MWTRPSSLAPPRVWRRLKGIRIEDLTMERAEEAIEHFSKYYLHDEPSGKFAGVPKDPTSISDLAETIREIIPDGISLIAVDENTKALAGLNILHVQCREVDAEKEFQETFNKFRGEASKKVFRMIYEVDNMVNVFDHFGVNTCLDSLGVSVSPLYQNRGLGREITWARIELAKQFGLPVTKSIFTSIYSQKIAEQVGLKTLAQVRFDEYRDMNGNRIFGDTSPHVFIKLMAARVPDVIPPPRKV